MSTPTSPAYPRAPMAADTPRLSAPGGGVDGGRVVGPPRLPAIGTNQDAA